MHDPPLRFVACRADVPASERQAIYGEIAALRGHLPGVVAMSSGPNVSPEGKNRGFDDGFIIDFADAASRDAYLVDPAHKAAGRRLVAALDGEPDAGLVVFDLEV